ncbi:MAG: hypothetical protein KAX05_15955, partial [Bacteroidales bacterium]|nr:hypothetical protein [Bacteroidales bacterium]
MKTKYFLNQFNIRIKKILSILVLFGLSTSAFSQVIGIPDRITDPTDQTLSPYFFVKSDNPEVDQLPLKETAAKVNIAGVIADITITQVYENQGNNTLEAIYVFPASTRAAVYSMKMTIG